MKTKTSPEIKTPKGYVIHDQDGELIAGFSAQHQVIQRAGNADYAKLFKTEKAAEKWASKYKNAGYGLASFTIHPY